MRLLRKITYGEFSEFVQEKKVNIIILFSVDACMEKLYFLRPLNDHE